MPTLVGERLFCIYHLFTKEVFIVLKRLILGVAAAATIVSGSAAVADISIGVIAPRGTDQAAARWSEYAAYLTSEIGQKVVMKPYLPSEVLKKAAGNDFMLVNPTQTVILMEKHKAKHLATLNKKSGSQFGGVIAVRKDSGIKKSADLVGKKVMGLKFRAAAGAYLFQTHHLIQKNINPHTDFASFTEGKTQVELVMAVNDKKIDAAFVRTGMLEGMAKKNKIKLSDFTAVDKASGKLLRTTISFPEWSLMAMPAADSGVAAKIKQSSMAMTAGSAASKKAKIKGFVAPVDIAPMREVMQDLGVYPYDD